MVSYEDKEFKLLIKTRDEADEKYALRMTPNTMEIVKLVENFISENDLICYGGIAINNILPIKARFYQSNDFPDYDFFSPDALNHVKKLADIYAKKGYGNIEAKSGFHYGTYKVYVNFYNIADITHIEPELYKNIKKHAIKKNKILYAPPNFLRMSMYLELSRPKGDTTRWEKILPRLKLLNKYYPLNSSKCFQKTQKLKGLQYNIYETLKILLSEEKVVFFGGFASTLYSKYSKKKNNISKTMKLDVLSLNAEQCANNIKNKLKDFKVVINHIPNIGELIPEHYSITVDNNLYANIYQSIACYTYNKIRIKNKTYNIATIFTMLSLYLIFVFADNILYDSDRIVCTAHMLQLMYEKNRLQKKGILRVYTIDCIGEQETFEDILLQKKKAHNDLKKKDSKYEKWFLRYTPKNK